MPIVNLIFNAVDAMPEGGTMTLQTRALGNGASIEVRDTGTGMDEQTRRRCLEPFFSTKGEHGNGLGLAMVYGMLKRHGGEIEIDQRTRPWYDHAAAAFRRQHARGASTNYFAAASRPVPVELPALAFCSRTMTPFCSSRCAPSSKQMVTM